MMSRNRRRPKPYKKDGDLFFGWNNTKWFIREFRNMYSSEPSYFSKKRIESGISFIIGQTAMILFIIFKYADIDMYDFIMWASLEFAVGGYITYQIQRQKRDYRNYYDNEYDEYGGNGGFEGDHYRRDREYNQYPNNREGGFRDDQGEDPEPTAPPPNAGSTPYPM